MEKEFLVKKYCEQKNSNEYSFYRTLNIEDGYITNDSFKQFTSIENDDKNLGFLITDEIIFLSYSNPRKFYKKFLKEYKNIINNNNIPQIYLDLKDESLIDKLSFEDMDKLNIVNLNNDKNKIK